jgi:hypothetical protein
LTALSALLERLDQEAPVQASALRLATPDFRVRIQLHGSHLRVEVSDQGGPWTQPDTTDERNGRGLLIVDQLARAWGRTGNDQTGWAIWFEMECW